MALIDEDSNMVAKKILEISVCRVTVYFGKTIKRYMSLNLRRQRGRMVLPLAGFVSGLSRVQILGHAF